MKKVEQLRNPEKSRCMDTEVVENRHLEYEPLVTESDSPKEGLITVPMETRRTTNLLDLAIRRI